MNKGVQVHDPAHDCAVCGMPWRMHAGSTTGKGCRHSPSIIVHVELIDRLAQRTQERDEALRRAASAELFLKGKIVGEYRSRASELDAATLAAVRAGIDRRCDIARTIHAKEDATDRALKRLIDCGLVTRTFIRKGATRYTAREPTQTKRENGT